MTGAKQWIVFKKIKTINLTDHWPEECIGRDEQVES
jgi:hypothetical protein